MSLPVFEPYDDFVDRVADRITTQSGAKAASTVNRPQFPFARHTPAFLLARAVARHSTARTIGVSVVATVATLLVCFSVAQYHTALTMFAWFVFLVAVAWNVYLATICYLLDRPITVRTTRFIDTHTNLTVKCDPQPLLPDRVEYADQMQELAQQLVEQYTARVVAEAVAKRLLPAEDETRQSLRSALLTLAPEGEEQDE